MKLISITRFLIISGLIPALAVRAVEPVPEFPDPTRFEQAIEAFERMDREQAPPKGAIVGVGSSSMRGWHSTIKEDLHPLTIVPRGFGGSNFNDLLHYMDRIVLSYRPRAILVYEGDNDSQLGIAPERIAQLAKVFADRVHAELPDCRIYFLSIKPSIRRWNIWPQMQEANRLLEAMCAEDPRLTYIDIATPMLDDEGQPKEDIFMDDKLHLVRSGYIIWRDAVRPVLLEHESERRVGPIRRGGRLIHR